MSIFLLPALWGFMASFSTNNQITLDSLRLPDHLHFENYSRAWNEGNFGTYVVNSVVVSSASSVLIAVMATMLGYALARLTFPGRSFVFAVMLSAIAMPVFAYLFPLT